MTYPLVDSILSNTNAIAWLGNIALINLRLLLLLLFILFLLRCFSFSAARIHSILFITFAAGLFLPFSNAWFPEIEFVFEVIKPLKESIPADATAINPADPTAIYNLSPSIHWAWYGLALYAVITFLLLFRIFRNNLSMQRLVSHAVLDTTNAWQQSLTELNSVTQNKLNVRIYISSNIASPMAWGLFKPVILIPHHAIHWPEEMRRNTLLHEIAHIKRFDCLTKQLAQFACAFYWANPFCWSSLRLLESHAEYACDNVVINQGIRKSRYAESLFKAAVQTSNKPIHWRAAVSLIDGGSHNKQSQLSKRIKAVLNIHSNRSPLGRWYLGLYLFFIAGFALPLASMNAKIVEEITYVIPASNSIIPIQIQTPELDLDTQRPFTTDKDKSLNEKNIFTAKSTTELSAAEVLARASRSMGQRFALNELKQKSIVVANPPRVPIFSVSEIDDNEEELKKLAALDFKQLVNQPHHSSQDGIHSKLANFKPSLTPGRVEPFTATHIQKPRYPKRAEAKGLQGELLVEFEIDTEGKVNDARVIHASPQGVFDRAVLQALYKNRYKPQKVNGKAVVASGVQEKYIFQLES